ncbi:DNA-binding GntR family transcriptional regulator [Subtercola boreus]|nr:DNA-binding GntR family transcriptional regulator [Subtercola boreus]
MLLSMNIYREVALTREAGFRTVRGPIRERQPLAMSSRRAYLLIRSAIRSGQFDLGEQLEERRLVDSLHLSRTAVRLALGELTAEGVLARRPRVGTIVSRRPTSIALPDASVPPGDLRRVSSGELALGWPFAGRIDLPGGVARVVVDVIHVDGDPVGVRTLYTDVTVEEHANTSSGLTVEAEFERRYGEAPARTESASEAISCDHRVGALLGLADAFSAVLLWRETVLFGRDGVPRMLFHTQYRGDRIAFSSSVAVPKAA